MSESPTPKSSSVLSAQSEKPGKENRLTGEFTFYQEVPSNGNLLSSEEPSGYVTPQELIPFSSSSEAPTARTDDQIKV